MTVFTISNESHFPGVVGLVESLRRNGFDGPIKVGVTDGKEDMIKGKKVSSFQVGDREDIFPGNMKPNLILNRKCEKFVYLDADIVVTNPRFLKRIVDWVDRAPVFAAESIVAPSDFRRHTWERTASPSPQGRTMTYYNSGMFAGIKSRDRGLLERWKHLIQTAVDPGDCHYANEDFPMPDQDALNAILQGRSPGKMISVQPPDWWNAASPSNSFFHVGGFLEAPAFLHCTIAQKPWLLDAIPPRPPNPYERAWVEHVIGDSASISHDVSLPLGIRRWLHESLDGRLAVKLKQLRDRLF